MIPLVYDHGIGVFNIQSRLNNGRCHQNIKIMIQKINHNILKLTTAHPSMGHNNSRVWHKTLYINGNLMDIVNTVMNIINLSSTAKLAVDGVLDNQRVIAEIDGQSMTKESFNNYMAYYDLYYTANGSTMPTGSKLTEFKKDLLDSLVQVGAMTAQAKKDNITIDEAAAESQAQTALDSLKTSAGNKYDSTLSKYNTNNDSFTQFMKTFMVDNSYASECYSKHMDYLKEHPEEELDQVVGKINDEEIKRGIYNYYYINEEMTSYYSGGQGLQTDDESVKETNKSIFNSIAQNKALIKYCEEYNIEIKQEEIDNALQTKQSIQKMMFQTDDELNQYLENYFLTKEKYDEYQKEDARGTAAGQAIQAKVTEDIKVSDTDLRKYYKDHKDSYDESTVSAEHILTEDEALANEIYDKAKDVKTKEDFEKIMNEYKSNEKVKEATDLGAFNKEKMVSEFSDAAFGMEKNSVSKPVKTEYGYHIIYVYDKNDAGEASFEDKKDEITKAVKEEKGTEDYNKLKEDLLKKEKIDIYDIKTTLESYMDQLKSELNIQVYEKKVQ